MTLNKSLLIPLVVFVLLVGILAVGFSLEDPHLLPSELVDEPFPEFELRQLHHPAQTSSREDFVGRVSLVNVWATWCPNCVVEHPELMRIAKEENIPLIGINYNDDPDKAIAWLERYKDPFELVVVDDKGRLAIDLGVYGAPETFVVDANGVIRYRHVGPVTQNIWQTKLAPVIEMVRAEESG